MNNFIFTTGYHGRQIYRKLNKSKKFKGFIDNNKNLVNKKFFNKPIFHPTNIEKLKIDKIYVAGGHLKEIYYQLTKKLKFDKKKIVCLSSNQIKFNNKQLKIREKKTLSLIKKIIKIFKDWKIDYWFANSSTLGIIRKDDLASFSDVDILVKSEHIKKFYNALKLKKIKFKFNLFKKKNKIKQIILTSGKQRIKEEPALLDIKPLLTHNNKFYQPIHDNKFLSYEKKFFKYKNITNYKDIKINIPFNEKKYLTKMYGKSWKKRAKFWFKDSYKNFS